MRRGARADVRGARLAPEPDPGRWTREAYVNGPLAELYGVDGVTGPAFRWVTLPEAERAGLLTRAGFLAVHAHYATNTPPYRGVAVLEQLVLCRDMGDPPPEAMDAVITGGSVEVEGEVRELTVRQDLARQTEDGVCAGCHRVINPIGFALEAYDPVGKWQTMERHTGLPVDHTGGLVGTDVDGAVSGPLELSERLANSQVVSTCFAEQWLTAALGRELTPLDQCAVDDIATRFAESGGDLRELIHAIVESDSFQLLNVGATEEP